MKLKWHWISILAVGIFLASGCKPVDEYQTGEVSSTLKWGHLNGTGGVRLINARPGETIEVCGEYQDYTLSAVQKWAAAIGRANGLKIVKCQGGSSRYTVKVQNGDGSISAPAVAYSNLTIKYLSRNSQGFMRAVLIHEVGHLWALCDQYPNVNNCDPSNSIGKNNSSVMGSTSPSKTELHSDDITGIRKLASRPDIAANAAWANNLNNSSGATPPPSTSGATPPPSGATPPPTTVGGIPNALGTQGGYNNFNDAELAQFMEIFKQIIEKAME